MPKQRGAKGISKERMSKQRDVKAKGCQRIGMGEERNVKEKEC